MNTFRQLPVFVYGTLRSGFSNHQRLAGRFDDEFPALLPSSALFVRGGLPWAVDRGNGSLRHSPPAEAGNVRGEVLRIRFGLYAEVLADLDDFEGFSPRWRPESCLYQRVARVVHYERDGRWEQTEAWVYLAGSATAEELTADELISDGVWRSGRAA